MMTVYRPLWSGSRRNGCDGDAFRRALICALFPFRCWLRAAQIRDMESHDMSGETRQPGQEVPPQHQPASASRPELLG